MDLFQQSSLKILRHGSLEILESALNTRKVLATDDGRLRDYRGLADFIGLTPIMMSKVESNPNHLRTLISIWCSQKDPESTTVQKLVDGLRLLDRHDVVDDVRRQLEADCIAAQQIGLATLDDVKTDNDALTMQDMESIRNGETLTKFDAIILHGEDTEDTYLAYHIADRMESIGKKIFLPERDLVAGTIEHAASASIIEKRCDRAIVIFSPNFLQSNINKLYTDLAQFVGLQRQRAVLIPVMFKRCENLPANLNMIAKLSYDPHGASIMNFYQRLFKTFGVDPKTLPKELLAYPDEKLNKVSSTSPINSAINHNVHYSNPYTMTMREEETENGFTLVSVQSSELNSISTTFSQLEEEENSRFSSIEQNLPEVPLHEPESSSSSINTSHVVATHKEKKSLMSKNPIRKLLRIKKKQHKEPLLN